MPPKGVPEPVEQQPLLFDLENVPTIASERLVTVPGGRIMTEKAFLKAKQDERDDNRRTFGYSP